MSIPWKDLRNPEEAILPAFRTNLSVLLNILDFLMFTMLDNIMVQYVYNKEE
jgi:hypothetical protein